jgi:hypothetical protein
MSLIWTASRRLALTVALAPLGLLAPDSSSEHNRHNTRRAGRQEHRDPAGHHRQQNGAYDNHHTADDDRQQRPHEPAQCSEGLAEQLCVCS